MSYVPNKCLPCRHCGKPLSVPYDVVSAGCGTPCIRALTGHSFECRCGAEFGATPDTDSFGSPIIEETSLAACCDHFTEACWACECGAHVTGAAMLEALERYEAG